MKTPTIPMHPSMLPQQRVSLVVPLPPCPESFEIRFDSSSPLDEQARPKKIPASARYLCQLEWAWGPTNDRLSAYYLSTNRDRSLWLLWHKAYSDDWGWYDSLIAHGPKSGVTWHAAACHLLLASLSREAKQGLDIFDWIAEEAELSCAEILAVAREIWPPEQVDALMEE